MDRVGQHFGIALVQRSGEPPAEIASLWPSLTKLNAPQVACAMAADGVPNRLTLEVPPHTQLRWAASSVLRPRRWQPRRLAAPWSRPPTASRQRFPPAWRGLAHAGASAPAK